MPSPVSALYGREVEVTAIERRVHALARGRGGVVVLEGAAGSGRTTLIDLAAARARHQGIAVFHGAAETPLGEILERLRQAAAGGPLLIGIDDVDRADDTTLLGLRRLPARLRDLPILWLMSLKPGRVTAAAGALERSGADVVRLASLDPQATRALAADVLGAEPSGSILDLIADLDGCPSPIVELLRGLKAEGLVQIVDGRARLTGHGLRRAVRQLSSSREARGARSDEALGLTRAELAVVELVARGATNRQAAEKLFLSPHTVSTHLRHTFEKLGIRSRVELAVLFADRVSAEAEPRCASAG